MLIKHKYIFLVLVIIIILVCVVILKNFIQKNEPPNMIERKLNVKLPSSSKIINYEYDSNGEYFGAKILIANQSVEDIRKQLKGYFGGEAPEKATKKLPNFKNVYSWWDLDQQDIEVFYVKIISGKNKWFTNTPKSRFVRAFICRDENDQYYLYISY